MNMSLPTVRLETQTRYSQNATTPAERPSRLHLLISSMQLLLNRRRGRRVRDRTKRQKGTGAQASRRGEAHVFSYKGRSQLACPHAQASEENATQSQQTHNETAHSRLAQLQNNKKNCQSNENNASLYTVQTTIQGCQWAASKEH